MRLVYIFILLAIYLAPAGMHPAAAEQDLSRLNIAQGSSIEIFAKVPGARSLAVVPDYQSVFVGTRKSRIYRVSFTGEVSLFQDGLNVPNAIAYHDNFLYVAEQHQLVRYDLRHSKPAPEVLYNQLPDKGWHGWRYAAFGPDGNLYLAVGSPCNVCQPRGLEGTIVRFLAPSFTQPEIVASGIRNSVGLVFHPEKGTLYFTDNGADWMGDELPPDELNELTHPGQFFGFPYFGGGHARTMEFQTEEIPMEVTFPVVEFDAHVAALGMAFWGQDLLVAQHGSWNRKPPLGYRIMRIPLDKTGLPTAKPEVFIDGWLIGDTAWGRPVDIKMLREKVYLVSDDYAGLIYKIRVP